MALLCQLPFVSESGLSAGKKSGDPDLRDAIGHLRWAPPVHSLMHRIISSCIMQNGYLLIGFLHFERPPNPEMSLHLSTQVANPIYVIWNAKLQYISRMTLIVLSLTVSRTDWEWDDLLSKNCGFQERGA